MVSFYFLTEMNKWSAADVYTEAEYEKGFLKPNGQTGPTGKPVWFTSMIEEGNPKVNAVKQSHGSKAEYNAAMREAILEKSRYGYDIYDDTNNRWLSSGPGYNDDVSESRVFESYPEPTKAELYKESVQKQAELGKNYKDYPNYNEEDWQAENEVNRTNAEAAKIEKEYQDQQEAERLQQEIDELEEAIAAAEKEQEEASKANHGIELVGEGLDNAPKAAAEEEWLTDLASKGAGVSGSKAIGYALDIAPVTTGVMIGNSVLDPIVASKDEEYKQRPHNTKLYWDPDTNERYYIDSKGKKVKDPYEDRAVEQIGHTYIPQHKSKGKWNVNEKTGELEWEGEDPINSGGYMPNPSQADLAKQHKIKGDIEQQATFERMDLENKEFYNHRTSQQLSKANHEKMKSGKKLLPKDSDLTEENITKWQQEYASKHPEFYNSNDDLGFFNNSTTTKTDNLKPGFVTSMSTVDVGKDHNQKVPTKTAPTQNLSDQWRYNITPTTDTVMEGNTSTKTENSNQSSPSTTNSTTTSNNLPVTGEKRKAVTTMTYSDDKYSSSSSNLSNDTTSSSTGAGGGGTRSDAPPTPSIGQAYAESMTHAIHAIDYRYGKSAKTPGYLPKVATNGNSFLRK